MPFLPGHLPGEVLGEPPSRPLVPRLRLQRGGGQPDEAVVAKDHAHAAGEPFL